MLFQSFARVILDFAHGVLPLIVIKRGMTLQVNEVKLLGIVGLGYFNFSYVLLRIILNFHIAFLRIWDKSVRCLQVWVPFQRFKLLLG